MEPFLRLLLRLYPTDFRRRYGDSMVDFFRQEWAAARSRRSRFFVLVRTLVDLLMTAARARVASFTRVFDSSGNGPRSTSMDRLSQDIRYALRSFARRPGFTAVIVATLALGIGANTALFTLVNEVVLRPLQIGEPERVVDISAHIPGGNSFTGFSYADYLDYEAGSSKALSEIAAYTARRVRFGPGLDAEPVTAQFTTSAYFDVVAVEPQLGATLGKREDGPVAVVSHAFWQSRLGGDRQVLGSTLQINDEPVTVIGVAAEGFGGTFIGFPTDLWIPLRAGELLLPGFDLEAADSRGLEFIGRMAPGISLDEAQAALDVLATQLESQHPVRNKGLRVGVHSTTGIDYSMRGGVLGFLGLLMVVAGLVLLITCLNVGGMLLVRAAARQKEISIRFAMGAGAGRLTRQLLTETFVLFAAGGALGAFVALALTDALLAGLGDLPAPRGLELGLDWRVLLFTAAAALLSSLVAGLFPAREALRRDLVTGLGSSRGSSEGRRGGHLRSAFVVAQIGAAVALLVGAGLFLRSLQEGQRLDPGFEADQVTAGRLTLRDEEFGQERGLQKLAEIRDRFTRIPGVEAVAFAQRQPIGVVKNPIEIEIAGIETAGSPGLDGGLVADANSVSPGYFSALEIPLLAGRSFRPEDVAASPRVAVINETLAQRFWSTGDAVGQRFRAAGEEVTIIGVAAKSRYLIQNDAPIAHLYLPLAQNYEPRVSVLVRSNGDPAALHDELRRTLQGEVPSQFPATFITLRSVIDRSLLPQRLASGVMMALGVFGLLLASLGVYGILAHSVRRRTREIGIRLALGGRSYEVVRLIVASGLRLVSIGILAGVGIALAMAPLVGKFLIGVTPIDLPTLAVVTFVLLIVGALACLVPALRAARIAPTETLRMD